MCEDRALLVSDLNEEKRKYELLRKISFELIKLSPLTQRLNNILQFLDESFNLKHTILLVPAKQRSVLKVFASRGFDQPGIGAEIPFDFGVVGAVASKKKMMRVSRLSQFKRYIKAANNENIQENGNIDYPRLEKSESLVAIPLIANDELVAVLSCESENILFFSQKDINLLLTLSNTIAIAIQNTIIYEELEERVKLRTAELSKINETKDHLFSVIAHDLRSPLSALEGVSDLFQYYSKNRNYDKMLDISTKVVRSTKSITELLDNLLNWSFLQKDGINYAPKTISLKDVICQVQRVFQGVLETKNIHLKVNISDVQEIYADYDMFYTILRNILSNAIKFSPQNKAIEINSHRIENTLSISIKDYGAGIENSVLDNLFTVNSKKIRKGTYNEKGSGFGLVLVYEYVHLNHGNIEIKTSNKGTDFRINFPIKE